MMGCEHDGVSGICIVSPFPANVRDSLVSTDVGFQLGTVMGYKVISGAAEFRDSRVQDRERAWRPRQDGSNTLFDFLQ